MYFAIKRSVDELGRIVLPKDVRNHYGIKTGDMLEVIPAEDGVLLKISFENDKKENENGGH